MQDTLQGARYYGLLDLLKGETIVTTSTTGGDPAVIRVPHSILAIIVTIFLATVGAGFWVVSSVTRIQANLDNIQASQREARSSQKLTTAYVTNETNRVQFMTGLLTPEKQRLVFEWDKANPRPPLPNAQEESDERNQ